MKTPLVCLGLALSLPWFTGCIAHETTSYREVSRVKVEFENDAAARTFYEALTQTTWPANREESKTQIHIPIVFRHEQRVVTGQNYLFNDAVLKCDTNQDGKITEAEARIYAMQKKTASR